MNIAICVSGSIRYPELGLKSINKIIPKGAKIFIHPVKNPSLYGVATLGKNKKVLNIYVYKILWWCNMYRLMVD